MRDLRTLEEGLRKRLGPAAAAGEAEIALRVDRGALVLEGKVADWATKVGLGLAAASADTGLRGLVNRIAVEGLSWADREEPWTGLPGGGPGSSAAGLQERPGLDGLAVDVLIIGGGVIGCAVARELTRWRLSVLLIEKEEDVAVHTSSRNDGMIHDGFAASPGSLKARYNVRGNRLWEPLAKDLGIEFRRPGSLLVFRSPGMAALYPALASRAAKNGVDGWELWSASRLRAEEPHILDHQHGAFFLPSAGILSPYKATVALAESAIRNGARVELSTWATGFVREGRDLLAVKTNRGEVRARAVVNAAGNWADRVAEWADDAFFSLHQRRGVDMILDAATGATQSHILGMPPLSQSRANTKGGGLILTVEGNLLVGPTAAEAPGREAYATSAPELRDLERHLRINTALSASQAITYFAGVRPCTYEEDFVIEASARVANLVHLAGIQSPGLAAAPAIAEEAVRLVLAILGRTKAVSPNPSFVPRREAPPSWRSLSTEGRAALIARDPAYGRIVCRCEEVSEGEVRAALASPLPATSLDALKRRVRTGMGRCHGGFCTPRAMEIVADALGVPLAAVTKKGTGSPIVLGETKA